MQEVTRIDYHTRNAKRLALSGVAAFRDGKVWKWVRSNHTGNFHFIVETNTPSPWAANFTRMIAPEKRITALKKYLQQNDEL